MAGFDLEVDLDFTVDLGCVAGLDFLEAIRLALSTRLPTPRPSRALCVGVEVAPEMCFSAGGASVGGLAGFESATSVVATFS